MALAPRSPVSFARGATTALESMRSAAGATAKIAPSIPAAQIGVHHDPGRVAVAERGNPTHRKTGQFMGLACGSSAHGQFTGDRCEPAKIDVVAARDEADDRDQPAIGTRGNENERLDDLIELDPQRRGSLFGGSRRRLKELDFEPDAFAQGCVDYSLDGWVRYAHRVTKSTMRSVRPYPIYRCT